MGYFETFVTFKDSGKKRGSHRLNFTDLLISGF